MIAAMALQHLVLAKTKESYDGSIAKTMSRRISQWKRIDIENLFNEAKALQFRLSKNSNKTDDSDETVQQDDGSGQDL